MQFEKADDPMAVTVLGIRTIWMNEQFSNAEVANAVTWEGIVMKELFLQDVQSLHS